MQILQNGKSTPILDDGNNRTLKEAIKINFCSWMPREDKKKIKVFHHSEYKDKPHLIEATFSQIREAIENIEYQILKLREEINLSWSYFGEINAKIEEKSQKTGVNPEKQPGN